MSFLINHLYWWAVKYNIDLKLNRNWCGIMEKYWHIEGRDSQYCTLKQRKHVFFPIMSSKKISILVTYAFCNYNGYLFFVLITLNRLTSSDII